MDVETRPSQHFLVMKTMHVVLILIGWLVFSVAQFVSTKDQTSENTRRISALENRPFVSTNVYENGQRAIEQRLQRIENKIDQQNDPPRRH